MKNTVTTHYRWIKWILFATFLIIVPVPYFLVVALGFVPTAAIILTTLWELIIVVGSMGAGDHIAVAVLMGTQAAILSGLLYLAALALARILCRALPKRGSIVAVTVLIGSLIVASCFDIYRLPKHASMPAADFPGVVRFVMFDCSGTPFYGFFRYLGPGNVPSHMLKEPPTVILRQRQAPPPVKIRLHSEETTGVQNLGRGSGKPK